MRPAEARVVVAALVTAYPSATVPQETIELYSNQIAKLSNVKAAEMAAEALISSREWFPTFAAFREEYAAAAKRLEPVAAPLPELPVGDRPPVPEFVLDFAAGLGAKDGPTPEQEARALEQVDGGKCADCLKEFPHRVRFGSLELCARCVIPRLRVAKVTA